MNFALILLVLLLLTGLLYAVDVFKFRKTRPKGSPDPVWVEWGASFFPVILVVFVLRSFVFEPFKIPSGSMIPTLLVGDFILVNKFTYGIRLPVVNKKILSLNQPERGDVMVFRYPEDPSLDYIKRVVGLPGDVVAYRNKRLTINGEPVKTQPDGEFLHQERLYYSKKFTETFNDREHLILNDEDAPAMMLDISLFPHRENCSYDGAGLTCKVPEGHYFMMGDNRDNSRDSRAWGFVPEENIVGKAFFIWFNSDLLKMDFSKLGRIGSFK